MLKALLIADQQRLHALVAASLGGSGVQLTIISSLASGIEQAVATSPELLFVQGRLSGLSMEIVSRHVVSHVDPQRTKTVIFADPGDDAGAAPSSQVCLDLSLPDSALESRIAALVKAAQPTQATAPPPATATDEFIPDLPPRPVTAPPAMESAVPASAVPIPASQPSVATRFETELETELARRTEEATPPPTLSEPPRTSPGQPRVGQAEAAELAARSRRRIVTAVTAGVLLVGAAVLATLFPPSRPAAPPKPPSAAKPAPAMARVSTAKSMAAVPPPAASPAPKTAAKPVEALRDPLPSFVPTDGRDPAYAAANPGWERYQDATREYKVFWEGEKLMALQIIDRTGSGLPAPFFTKAMQELAGVRDYKTTSREVKDNHLVKKGTLGAAGSIIIYKNKGDSVLQAFVIHFDKDRNRRR